MRKSSGVTYKLKLSHLEIRVAINALNASRLKLKAAGKDHTAESDLILRLIDLAES